MRCTGGRRRSHPCTPCGRYGACLDTVQQNKSLNRLILEWDYKNKCVLGVDKKADNKDYINRLCEQSPLEDNDWTVQAENVNKLFSKVVSHAEKYKLDNIFTEIIGPIAKDESGAPLMQAASYKVHGTT